MLVIGRDRRLRGRRQKIQERRVESVETRAWRREHGGESMEARAWRREHGDASMETRAWRREHGDASMETRAKRQRAWSSLKGAHKLISLARVSRLASRVSMLIRLLGRVALRAWEKPNEFGGPGGRERESAEARAWRRELRDRELGAA